MNGELENIGRKAVGAGVLQTACVASLRNSCDPNLKTKGTILNNLQFISSLIELRLNYDCLCNA